MNCPLCLQTCQEEPANYGNIIICLCHCQKDPDTFRANFICDIYKHNREIHQFYIYLESISLHFMRYPGVGVYKWEIYTNSQGTKHFIDLGLEHLSPEEAYTKLKRYNNLLPLS